jgi:hypothetical protein
LIGGISRSDDCTEKLLVTFSADMTSEPRLLLLKEFSIMNQTCGTALKPRCVRFRWCAPAWICPLFLLLLVGSWSQAAQPEPDLRLETLLPVDHPLSVRFKPPFSSSPCDAPGALKQPGIPKVVWAQQVLDIRIPFSASLQTSYKHTFQHDKHDGRFALDGLGLVPVSQRIALLGEVHAELENLHFVAPNWLQYRLDWSGGLGIRGLQTKDVLLGVNFFLDKSRLRGKWYNSGGVGIEMAAKVSDFPQEVFDLAVNLHKGGGIQAEAGFSVPLREDVDLRVSLGKSRFYDGDYLLGWKAGADLNVCGDFFVLTYTFEQDRDRSACHTIGAALSANLNLEDVFSCAWPFEQPKKSARSETTIASHMNHRVKRNWHQPDSFVTFASNSPALWNAPGGIRWDGQEDFSPTVEAIKFFFTPGSSSNPKESGRKDKSSEASLGGQLAFMAVGAVTTITTGVMEFGYRSLFGPFSTEPDPKAQPERSAKENERRK